MIAVHNDKQLRDWGFKLSLTIHDELMGECPKEHAFECSERLMQIMCEVGSNMLQGFPIKGDPSVVKCWYGTEITRQNQAEVDAEVLEP